MTNEQKLKEFYEGAENPLTVENLEILVGFWQQVKERNDSCNRYAKMLPAWFYDMLVENKYPTYCLGLNENEYYTSTDFYGRKIFEYNKKNNKDKSEEIKRSDHQLYVPAGREMINVVIENFIRECVRNGIPFRLSALDSLRSDNLIIETTDDYLFDTIEILKKLENNFVSASKLLSNKNKEMFTVLKPPLLTIPVTDRIGYGSRASYGNTYLGIMSTTIYDLLAFCFESLEKGKTDIDYDKLQAYMMNRIPDRGYDSENIAFSTEVAKRAKALRTR